MSRPAPTHPTPGVRRLVAAVCLALGLAGTAAAPAATAAPTPAPRAVGDEVIAFVEVEDGTIAGGPGLNSGDHGNFSGSGSYTFRETGMSSTMSVTAPAAGTYPVWIRYAAGPLGADENVTRSMGLLTNGGARQVVSYPMTSFENWEAWRFARADVTLVQGANTIAVACDRGTDFCRLNFDAVQVGGLAPDTCAATPTLPGHTALFDGTFGSFDGWRKAGAGGFGRQSDCSIMSQRGRGATWFTTQQTAPYTLTLDWRRNDANDDSSVYLGSSSRGGADPVGGYTIPIGEGTGGIVPTGGAAKPAEAAAVATALRPVGQWNTYTISLTGTQVKVALNGTVVNTYTAPTAIPAAGFVGLENRGFLDTVRFRGIQLKPGVDAETREVQVLGINDLHGRLLPDGPEAGAAVLAGAVKQLRAQNPDTVLAGAGDLIGGSTFESLVQDDAPTIDALNEAGLDVSAVGSHELDRGYADLTGRVAERADWDYLAANLRRTSDGSRALAPTWTKDFGDVEVGFVGAVTEDLRADELEATDVVTEVDAAAEALEAAGADVVVLLVNEGAGTTEKASATDGSVFGQIVDGVGPAVDAIISGRSHQAYNHAVRVPAWVTEGRTVVDRPVVSAGAHGTHLNRLTFTVDTATGAVTATTQSLLPLVTTPAYPADAATQVIVDAAVAQAAALGAATLATTTAPVGRARVAGGAVNPGGESVLGNLVADAQRSDDARIAFVSPTALAADLPGGDVTLGRAAQVQPSAEPLVDTRLTGGQIEAALEQQWQRAVDGSQPAQAFLRLGTSSGFRYTYDPTRAEGSRITGMSLDGAPVSSTASYTVTLSADLAAGGDNFRAFARGTEPVETGQTDLSALLDHLHAAGTPVAVDAAQHAVGVSFPEGLAASYEVGEGVAVDLSSLAFTGAADPKDATLRVSLGGRSLGDVPVDNTVGDAASDEQGAAAVRVVVPTDMPAGPTTLRIVGATTGTTVELPLTITRDDPPAPAVSATVLSAPASVAVGTGRAALSVSVASASATPTGQVEVLVDGVVTSTVSLVDGRARAIVGPFATAGTRSVTARYLGSDVTAPSTSPVARIAVTKAAPRVAVTVRPGTVVARRTQATLAIAVTAPGARPTGAVSVKVGTKTYAGVLKGGALTIRLPRFAQAGAVRVAVAYAGDARTRAGSATTRIVVLRARR